MKKKQPNLFLRLEEEISTAAGVKSENSMELSLSSKNPRVGLAFRMVALRLPCTARYPQ